MPDIKGGELTVIGFAADGGAVVVVAKNGGDGFIVAANVMQACKEGGTGEAIGVAAGEIVLLVFNVVIKSNVSLF